MLSMEIPLSILVVLVRIGIPIRIMDKIRLNLFLAISFSVGKPQKLKNSLSESIAVIWARNLPRRSLKKKVRGGLAVYPLWRNTETTERFQSMRDLELMWETFLTISMKNSKN